MVLVQIYTKHQNSSNLVIQKSVIFQFAKKNSVLQKKVNLEHIQCTKTIYLIKSKVWQTKNIL